MFGTISVRLNNEAKQIFGAPSFKCTKCLLVNTLINIVLIFETKKNKISHWGKMLSENLLVMLFERIFFSSQITNIEYGFHRKWFYLLGIEIWCLFIWMLYLFFIHFFFNWKTVAREKKWFFKWLWISCYCFPFN